MIDLATGLSEEQMARIEAALAFYAKQENHFAPVGGMVPNVSPVFRDGGFKARDALELVALARAQGPRQDGEFVLVPRADLEEARDLLMERRYGSPARSPGHNARLIIDDLLSASPVPTLPEVGGSSRGHEHSAEKATPDGAATWLPIETAPKDRPILAWCNHEADPWMEADGKTLTLYAAHREGLGHATTGMHILVWGGAWDDRTYEFDGGHLPDWWFAAGSEFEVAANPTHWMPLPAEPADGTGKGPVSTAEASQASVRNNPSSLNKGEGR